MCPASLTTIPRGGSFTTIYSPSSESKGLSKGFATYTAPVSFSVRTGVSTSTEPIFDSSGQPDPGSPPAVSAAYCAGVQTPRPEPADGLTVYPTGSVSVVSFKFDVAIVSGCSQLCGTSSETFKPLGDSAAFVVGCVTIDGLNGTRSHSTIGGISVSAFDQFGSLRSGEPSGSNAPWCSQESVWIVASSGSPEQLVGSARNGLTGMFTSSPPPWHLTTPVLPLPSSQSLPRSASCSGEAGRPQVVTEIARGSPDSWVSGAVIVRPESPGRTVIFSSWTKVTALKPSCAAIPGVAISML